MGNPAVGRPQPGSSHSLLPSMSTCEPGRWAEGKRGGGGGAGTGTPWDSLSVLGLLVLFCSDYFRGCASSAHTSSFFLFPFPSFFSLSPSFLPSPVGRWTDKAGEGKNGGGAQGEAADVTDVRRLGPFGGCAHCPAAVLRPRFTILETSAEGVRGPTESPVPRRQSGPGKVLTFHRTELSL